MEYLFKVENVSLKLVKYNNEYMKTDSLNTLYTDWAQETHSGATTAFNMAQIGVLLYATYFFLL